MLPNWETEAQKEQRLTHSSQLLNGGSQCPSSQLSTLCCFPVWAIWAGLSSYRGQELPVGVRDGSANGSRRGRDRGSIWCVWWSKEAQKRIFFHGGDGACDFYKLEGCLGIVKPPPFQLCKIKGSSKHVCSAIIFVDHQECPSEKLLPLSQPGSH